MSATAEGNEWAFYSPFQGSQDFTHWAATSDAVAFFFFSQYQGQRKKENKGSHLLSKKEGRGRKGSKLRHRWENMNILAKKAKQKGTEPLTETSVKLESWAAPLQDHRGLRRDEMELVLSGKLKSVPSTVCSGLGSAGGPVSRASLDYGWSKSCGCKRIKASSANRQKVRDERVMGPLVPSPCCSTACLQLSKVGSGSNFEQEP